MSTSTVTSVTSAELFQDEVPVLRPSLVKHGLVDLTCPSSSPRLNQPRSSEDLKAADIETSEGDEGESGWVRAGGAEDTESEDVALDALLGVDNIVVGHYRAAAELRRTFLSPKSPRDPLQARGRKSRHKRTSTVAYPRMSAKAVKATSGKVGGGMEDRTRNGGYVANRAANAAASAAVAAALEGGREEIRGRLSTEGDIPELGLQGKDEKGAEVSSSWSMKVSRSAVLDIANKLFGSSSSSSSSRSNGSVNANINGDSAKVGGRREDAGDRKKRDGNRSLAGFRVSNALGGAAGSSDMRLVTFTVDVHTGGSMRLGIGVKELGGGAVVVQELHKPAGTAPGPAECAGVVLGDVILGINYVPLEKGLIHTASLLAEAIKRAGFVKLQISRHVNAGSRRQSFPGRDCPIVTDLMWRTAQLRRAGVLDSSERHTIAGFILQLMAWDEGTSLAPPPPPPMLAPLAIAEPGLAGDGMQGGYRSRDLGSNGSNDRSDALPPSLVPGAASTQLDSLVLRVKGLREAIYVRCLHAKTTFEPAKPSGSRWSSSTSDASTSSAPRATVRYVLRAEDISTGREWLVFPRYSDFSELHQELLTLWPPVADLPFPPRLPVAGLLPGAAGVGGAVVEERIVMLEAFMHGALTLLGIYASVDPRMRASIIFAFSTKKSLAPGRAEDAADFFRCSGGLRIIQDFLGMPRDLFLAEVSLPPALREQKRAELLLYKLLNRVDSPASRFKHRIMKGFASDVVLAPDVETLMEGMSNRLCSLQEFLEMQHQQQLSSYLDKSDLSSSSDSRSLITHKAVRRQVELSLYLPLRRCLCNELAMRLKGPARNLQRAIKTLRRFPPSVFGVDYPDVLSAEKWPPARDAMGQATRRVLPTDQVEGLCRAAEHIAALHASLQQSARVARQQQQQQQQAGHCQLADSIAANGLSSRASQHVTDSDYIPHTNVTMGGLRGGNVHLSQLESELGKTTGEAEIVDRELDVAAITPMEEVTHSFLEQMDPGGDPEVEDRNMHGSCPCPSPASRHSSHVAILLSAPPANGFVGDQDGRNHVEAESNHEANGSMAASSSSTESDKRGGPTGSAGAAIRAEAEDVSTMGADDFLPLFALTLVHSAPLDLLLPQTLLTHLMDVEGSLSEEGYLVATLEAAVSFITQIHASHCAEQDGKSP